MGKKKVVLDQFDFIRAIACLGIAFCSRIWLAGYI